MTDRTAPTVPTGWNGFWFTPAPAATLHRLRFLTGLVLCGWMLSFAGHQEAFFSLDGWFDKTAYIEVNRPNAPTPAPIGWSIFYLAGNNRVLFDSLYWGSLTVVLLFTLGIATRLTGVLTWVATVSFLANPASSYDADFLLGILAFYMMLGYLFLGFWGRALTPLECVLGPMDTFVLSRWLGGPRRDTAPGFSYAANVTVRLLQVHFAIIVVTSGLHKLQIADWWAGVALWYPLHPPLTTNLDQLLQERNTATVTLWFLSAIQYLALAWQIGFPAFAWRGGTWRIVLLGGAVAGWIGTAFVLGLPLFGPIYLIGSLSYLHAEEWNRAGDWFRARFGGTASKPVRATGDPHRIKVTAK
ncbi:MAG: hypothetical protein L0Y71_04585 [Gemmataceae bacterium]|nr:hypothetical protein [Gemmataceae bacterium]